MTTETQFFRTHWRIPSDLNLRIVRAWANQQGTDDRISQQAFAALVLEAGLKALAGECDRSGHTSQSG